MLTKNRSFLVLTGLLVLSLLVTVDTNGLASPLLRQEQRL
jgi:hypothetical protein